MIIDSLVSALKNMPFPSLSSTWRGRQVTVLTLGALSLGLVAFLLKKVFWKPETQTSDAAQQTQTPAKTPARSSAQVKVDGAEEPLSPEKPAIEALSNSIINVTQTPIGRFDRSRFLETPMGGATPDSSGRNAVLSASCIEANRTAIAIDLTSFTFTLAQNIDNSFTSFFPNGSTFYVGQQQIEPQGLVTTLSNSDEWDSSSSIAVKCFLSSLNQIGQQSIKTLYSLPSFNENPLAHKPMYCSVARNENIIEVTFNNLFYPNNNLSHQLYLSAKNTGNEWSMDVFCTTWNRDPLHPLQLPSNNKDYWVLFLKESMGRLGYSLESHPLIKDHIGILAQSIGQATLKPVANDENPGKLNEIFRTKDLEEACGKLSKIDDFNCSRLLLSYLEKTITEGASLEVLKTEGLTPQIFKYNDTTAAHLFLQTSNGNIFEVVLSLVIHFRWKMIENNEFISVEIKDGFFVEWMKKEQSNTEHPLITYLSAPEKTQLDATF